MTAQNLPIACDLGAIPADQRSDHMETAEQLLLHLASETQELPDGYVFTLAAERYPQVAAFIENERRCCPFFTFVLEVPPGEAPLRLRITGPEGAKEMLGAMMVAGAAWAPG
jgi:hypothetical protein